MSSDVRLYRGDWLPIETAPKDGTHILAAIYNGQAAHGYAMPGQSAYRIDVIWWDSSRHVNAWVCYSCCDDTVEEIEEYGPFSTVVTHWMRLPPVPDYGVPEMPTDE